MSNCSATERLLRKLERTKESARPLERLLRQSEAELQHLPQEETLERFVEDVAIYFANVFDAVTSYGKILQMRVHHNDPLQAHAQLILDDAQVGRRLTGNLLRKRGSARLRLLALDHFIRGLSPLLSRIVKNRITLRIALAGPVRNERTNASCQV